MVQTHVHMQLIFFLAMLLLHLGVLNICWNCFFCAWSSSNFLPRRGGPQLKESQVYPVQYGRRYAFLHCQWVAPGTNLYEFKFVCPLMENLICDIFDSNFQIRSCWDKWCLDFLSHPTDNICQRVQGPACRWAAQIPLQWCWFFPSNHWRYSQSHEKCHWAWIYDIVDMGPLVHRTAYSQISKIYHIYQNPLVAKKRVQKNNQTLQWAIKFNCNLGVSPLMNYTSRIPPLLAANASA